MDVSALRRRVSPVELGARDGGDSPALLGLPTQVRSSVDEEWISNNRYMLASHRTKQQSCRGMPSPDGIQLSWLAGRRKHQRVSGQQRDRCSALCWQRLPRQQCLPGDLEFGGSRNPRLQTVRQRQQALMLAGDEASFREQARRLEVCCRAVQSGVQNNG